MWPAFFMILKQRHSVGNGSLTKFLKKRYINGLASTACYAQFFAAINIKFKLSILFHVTLLCFYLHLDRL